MLDSTALLSNARDAYTAGVQGQLQNQARGNAVLDEEQARQAAEQFESFFIGQMLEYMHTDVDGQGMFGGGHAEDVWRSMLNQEYGKEKSKSGSLGIADAVMRSLLAAQGDATTGPKAPPLESAQNDTPTAKVPVAAAIAQYSERMN